MLSRVRIALSQVVGEIAVSFAFFHGFCLSCLIMTGCSAGPSKRPYGWSQAIHRTAHRRRPAVEDVGVNHRRLSVTMIEQLLHGSDVATGFQKMGGEEDQCARSVRILIPERRCIAVVALCQHTRNLRHCLTA